MPLLFQYLLKKFLWALLLVTAAFLLIIFIIDAAELFRRTASRDIHSITVIYMAALKLPTLAQLLIPFMTLFAGLTVFRLKQELTVMRAAGYSVVQILAPMVIGAFLFGCVMVFGLQGLTVKAYQQFEALEEKIFLGEATKQQPVYLRQRNEDGGSTLLLARKSKVPEFKEAANDGVLFGVTVLNFNAAGTLTSRYDVKRVVLQGPCWFLKNGVKLAENQVANVAEICLPTTMTREQLLEVAAEPSAIPFWQLQRFIKQQKASGFSANRYVLQWHLLLATPFLYAAMVIMAAAFALRPVSRTHGAVAIFFTIGTGFLLYFGRDILIAMGMSGKLPVLLASWSPILLVGMLSAARLLDREG